MNGCVAFRDGGLQERDQILVINGVPLEAGVSQQQALALLQQPGELVELVVARERGGGARERGGTVRTVSRQVRFSSSLKNVGRKHQQVELRTEVSKLYHHTVERQKQLTKFMTFIRKC